MAGGGQRSRGLALRTSFRQQVVPSLFLPVRPQLLHPAGQAGAKRRGFPEKIHVEARSAVPAGPGPHPVLRRGHSHHLWSPWVRAGSAVQAQHSFSCHSVPAVPDAARQRHGCAGPGRNGGGLAPFLRLVPPGFPGGGAFPGIPVRRRLLGGGGLVEPHPGAAREMAVFPAQRPYLADGGCLRTLPASVFCSSGCWQFPSCYSCPCWPCGRSLFR